MKINESTSISLKLVLSILPFAIGFGGWMFDMHSTTSSLQIKSSTISKKLKTIQDDVGKIKSILMDRAIIGKAEEDEDTEGFEGEAIAISVEELDELTN